MSDAMSDLEWEEAEERIGNIARNGNTGEHYFHLSYLEQKQAMMEQVNHPQHYQLFPDQDVLSVIKESLTTEEYKGFLKGNVLKYRLRAGYKGDIKQDIDKAETYRKWLFELEN